LMVAKLCNFQSMDILVALDHLPSSAIIYMKLVRRGNAKVFVSRWVEIRIDLASQLEALSFMRVSRIFTVLSHNPTLQLRYSRLY